MLFGLIIVPIIAVATIAGKAVPFAVAIAAILAFWGGILRMSYALLFESNDVENEDKKFFPAFLKKNFSSGKNENSLLPAHPTTNLNYLPPVAGWRDTNDLISVPSVTDETTTLLEKKQAS